MVHSPGNIASRIQAIHKQAQAAARPTSGPAKANPKFEPTPEQSNAVRQFDTQDSLKLIGYAGAAKTSTLELIAHSATKRRGIYLAFNKAIVNDAAKRFPTNVQTSTTHSLAVKQFLADYERTKLFGKTNAKAVASALEIDGEVIGGKYLTDGQIAARVQETITNFCNSGDTEVALGHVHLKGRIAAANDPYVAEAIREHVFRLATNLWPKMIDKDDLYPLGHDGYLKLWSLTEPEIAADFILLDEAQDTNPCVIDVLKHQKAQLVFVGDPSQQIYQWRGAVDAMARIPSTREAYLTQSFRFGESLAEVANVCLALLRSSKPLRGNSSRFTSLGACQPSAILARSNAGAIRAVFEALATGRTPYIVGGKHELLTLLRAVGLLKRDIRVTVPEFFGYANWNEVVDAVRDEIEPGLKILVDLVKAHGEDQLIATLMRCPEDEAQTDVAISTIHKAKGREWDSVEIVDDFTPPARMPKARNGELTEDQIKQALDTVKEDEVRLLYVGMTRAKKQLSIPLEIDFFLKSFSELTGRYWSGSIV